MISGNIFEDYMEAQDQIKRNFLNNGSFHACPGLKGPLSPDEGIVSTIKTEISFILTKVLSLANQWRNFHQNEWHFHLDGWHILQKTPDHNNAHTTTA